MPENNANNQGFADPEKNNADVAKKLLEQNAETLDVDVGPASDALDKLAQEAQKKADAAAAATPPVVEPKEDKDESPDVQPLPDKDKDKGKSGTAPPEPTEAEKATAKEKADAEAKQREEADKIFKDSPSLPANASPKSSEAFNAIKIKAAQVISAREAELEKLRKEKSELEQKLKNPIPEDVAKELEDHRNWRAKLDIDADPKFKEFDKSIASTQEFIYAQLRKSPKITNEVIEKIKAHGGPENVKLDAVFEAIGDPVTQRLVESKIADIEMAKYNKEMAIRAAKENVGQYREARSKAMIESQSAHTNATKESLGRYLGALEWAKEKTADEKADENTKKSVAEYNKFLDETRAQIENAVKDDSAEMRAILITGMAQLFYERRETAGLKAELEATKKNLADVTAKWEKIKQSSGRLSTTAPATATTVAKPTHDVTVPAGDALDAIAKQVMEKRAAEANK